MAETKDQIPFICVDRDSDGRWDVSLPTGGHVTCDSLDDARRVAAGRAARQAPWGVIVRDAYHRVIVRENPYEHSPRG